MTEIILGTFTLICLVTWLGIEFWGLVKLVQRMLGGATLVQVQSDAVDSVLTRMYADRPYANVRNAKQKRGG